MNAKIVFTPTQEQETIINHPGHAFISACPGSGKTRVIVERARNLLANGTSGRGIALLSFTNAAVAELGERLRRERVFTQNIFPSYIGTFDSFVWEFLIAPFGVPGSSAKPRLIPDKDGIKVVPYPDARELPLGCFDRSNGLAIAEELNNVGFRGSTRPYETAARKLRERLIEQGQLDFTEAREIALVRLRNPQTSKSLGIALSARFIEFIVDEAQDCNPVDLEVVGWFRQQNIPVKVICDPYQSIYSFRGSVTTELVTFSTTFDKDERLSMTGNFRSSRHIARAIAAFRPQAARAIIDEALGIHRDELAPVYLFSYSGRSVPASVGQKFRELTAALGLEPRGCPVLAATRLGGARALGYPAHDDKQELSCRLATAVSDYHFSFTLGCKKAALESLHRIVLELSGHLQDATYHQTVVSMGIEVGQWRSEILSLAEQLKYDPTLTSTAEAWLERARVILNPTLANDGRTIGQRLRQNADLASRLSVAPASGYSARTIHSVKGMEFPAVCLVMSPQTSKGILDYLTTTNPSPDNEETRKLYVGASRAQRLLVIAAPKSQAQRLHGLIVSTDATVLVTEL